MKIIKIFLSLLLVLIIIGASGIFYLSRGLKKGSTLEVSGVDILSLKDGVYQGKYDYGRWSNELRVTVENHKITKIDIVKDVTFSKTDVSKELFMRVMESQDTRVDAVTGATVTSKAYLKAIENSLNQ